MLVGAVHVEVVEVEEEESHVVREQVVEVVVVGG